MTPMDETIKLIEQAHQGDKTARDKLVMDNMGLVWSIVRRFGGRGYELEDLSQIGSIGLIKAIDKFETAFDVKFSTYAVPMITGEIKRFLRDDGMIKVSRSLKEMAVRVRSAREEISGLLGREPTIDEIAEKIAYLLEHPNNERIMKGLDLEALSYKSEVQKLQAICERLVSS